MVGRIVGSLGECFRKLSGENREEVQRLRVSFSRSEEIKYISHLDLSRCWARVLRRADISLAYSRGFTPHPRISVAAPLSLGMTSEAELMDIFLIRRTSPHFLVKAVNSQLPLGLGILGVQEIPLGARSLQSSVRSAEYRVTLKADDIASDVQLRIDSLLKTDHLQWHHMRDTGPRHYDLRALIRDIWLIAEHDGKCVVGMLLRCDPQGSGRPEQVAAALGFSDSPISVHRTKLVLVQR